MARTRKNNSTKRSVDFSKAGKPFAKDEAVHLVVKEANWEKGNAGDYIAITFGGVDEFENSTVYHNASVSEKALGRTREMLEAMGYEIDDSGDTDIDTAELIGLEVMAETYEDRYEGGKSIKVDNFYPVEDGGKSSKKGGKKTSKKDEAPELDLDNVDEDDLKKLAKKLKVKGFAKLDEDELKEALGELDADDVKEAAEALDIDLDGAGGGAGGDFDLDDLDEDDLKKLAKKLGVKKYTKMDEDELKEALGKEDEDEVKEAATELGLIEDADAGDKGKGSSKGGSEKKSKGLSEDDISDMSEEQLETLIKKHKLDVDLDDFKTLRKKQNAVIDAAESEGLIKG